MEWATSQHADSYLVSPYARTQWGSPNLPSSVEYPTVNKKRKRVTAVQLRVLNEVYARTTFPTTGERLELASKLDMSARGVQLWFQNKRQSARRNRWSTDSNSRLPLVKASSFDSVPHSEGLRSENATNVPYDAATVTDRLSEASSASVFDDLASVALKESVRSAAVSIPSDTSTATLPIANGVTRDLTLPPAINLNIHPRGGDSEREPVPPDRTVILEERLTKTDDYHPANHVNSQHKRKRMNATRRKVLNEVYFRTAFPTAEERVDLANKLDMSPRNVRSGFKISVGPLE